MMDTAIVDVENLEKQYGNVKAVDGLNLRLGTPGTVHGFLGPNGSGKTTTIRCLLGLVRPTGGTARVFGKDAATDLHDVLGRVGAIVENPKMFPKFSGRKNLELLARIRQIPDSAIDGALTSVGLADRAGDDFETYSLGMKQRLAIAGALLKDPDLLILDEPGNGLDPAGIAEMRNLIRSIANSGKAVLVSSHQLSEIEQVCDEVTIIQQGRLVASGSLESIRASAGPGRVLLTIGDQQGALSVLNEAQIPATIGARAGEILATIAPERASELNRLLADRGLYLSSLNIQQASLEDAFFSLTGPAAPTGTPSQAPPVSGVDQTPLPPAPGQTLPQGASGQTPLPSAPPQMTSPPMAPPPPPPQTDTQYRPDTPNQGGTQ